MSRIAVYPGSFDPITYGHLDIVQRAGRLFSRVIVAVADNAAKKHTFSAAVRVAMARASVRGIPGAEADSFKGLLVDYMKRRGAHTLIRGLRAVSDMDYEFQMASMNRQIYPEAETVFLMPDERYTYLSSSIIKSVAGMGAEVDQYLPPAAAKVLRRKLKAR